MALTRAEVEAKAKELGIELSDDKIKACVSLGVMPTKEMGEASGSQTGDDDDDHGSGDDGKGAGDGAQKRIQQLNDKRKAEAARAKAAEERAAAAEAKLAEIEKGKAVEKGDFEKLANEAKVEKERAAAIVAKSKEKVKIDAVRSALTEALIAQGIPNDRLPDALALCDRKKVEDHFEWTDEESLEYEVDADAVKAIAEDFKKSKPYLFESSSDGDDGSSSGFSGQRPRNAPQAPEKRKEAVKKKFPHLFN